MFAMSTPLPCPDVIAFHADSRACAMDRIFKRAFLMGWSYIAGPAELSIPVLLDEKSTVVPVRLAGEQSGGKRKVSYGDARSNSERAAPSACVGRRLSAPQIVWNRSTRRAGARGGPRGDRARRLRSLTITGRIIDGGDNLQGPAAVGTVFHVDVEDAFEQPGPS